MDSLWTLNGYLSSTSVDQYWILSARRVHLLGRTADSTDLLARGTITAVTGERTLGSLVRRYRQAVPLTQQGRLADKVGLHLKAIQKIEFQARRSRGRARSRKLAEAPAAWTRALLAEAAHPNST